MQLAGEEKWDMAAKEPDPNLGMKTERRKSDCWINYQPSGNQVSTGRKTDQKNQKKLAAGSVKMLSRTT